MTADLCCNIEIDHERATYGRRKEVRLHICGTDGRVWLTPDEARHLAKLLAHHADLADEKKEPK